MPFKSEAQRRKFLEMVKTGEISQETFDEWDSATDRSRLPPKVKRHTKLARIKTVKVIK